MGIWARDRVLPSVYELRVSEICARKNCIYVIAFWVDGELLLLLLSAPAEERKKKYQFIA